MARRLHERATMVADGKLEKALWALNFVLVEGRTMAYDSALHGDLAAVFDAAEVLPILVLKDTDETELFREILVDLVSDYPRMQEAVDRFDGRGAAFVRGAR
jgi:hypothetical protein